MIIKKKRWINQDGSVTLKWMLEYTNISNMICKELFSTREEAELRSIEINNQIIESLHLWEEDLKDIQQDNRRF